MRFYDGVVAVVVGVVATSLAGCGGGAATTTTTATPFPSPPGPSPPGPSPPGPSPPGPSPPGPSPPGPLPDLPTVTTPTVSNPGVTPPSVTCDDTSLGQSLSQNLSCTTTMNETNDVCCRTVAAWGGNVDVLVDCNGTSAATRAEKEQVYRARCMCAGSNKWEEQLVSLSSVNMTACTYSSHPVPGGPTLTLQDPVCACQVLTDARTALKESAADQCEYYVDGAISTFGWGSLATLCDDLPSSDLSVESDARQETPRVASDAQFPWALVAAAGVAGLFVMVVFRIKSRASVQSSDVTELGASC